MCGNSRKNNAFNLGGGGIHKNYVGVCGTLPETLVTQFQTKMVKIDTQFQTIRRLKTIDNLSQRTYLKSLYKGVPRGRFYIIRLSLDCPVGGNLSSS